MMVLRRIPTLPAALAALALLGGCASTGQQNAAGETAAAGKTTAAPHPQDPFEGFNRSIYAFNDGLDRAVLKPAATLYRKATPQLARDGVGNFFSNLGEIWSFANNALQGQGEGAFNSVVRFSINTVFGLGGLIDIASEAGIARHKQDFGHTLAHWGVPAGPYLMLPLLGPSTMRDTAALPLDWRASPLAYVDDAGVRGGLYVLRTVDGRARLLGASDTLDAVAIDRYSLLRDVYLGQRGALDSGDGRIEDYDDDDYDNHDDHDADDYEGTEGKDSPP